MSPLALAQFIGEAINEMKKHKRSLAIFSIIWDITFFIGCVICLLQGIGTKIEWIILIIGDILITFPCIIGDLKEMRQKTKDGSTS